MANSVAALMRNQIHFTFSLFSPEQSWLPIHHGQRGRVYGAVIGISYDRGR